MASYRVYFEYNAITYEVLDKIGFLDLSFVTQRESGEVFYRTKLEGTIKFLRNNNEALYDVLIALYDNLNDRCEEIDVRIDKICGGSTEVGYWNGVFTPVQMGVNICTCKMEVGVQVLDDYNCILEDQELSRNFFNANQTAVNHIIQTDIVQEGFFTGSAIPKATYEAIVATGSNVVSVDLALFYDVDNAFVVQPAAPNAYDNWPTTTTSAVFLPEPPSDRWATGAAAAVTAGQDRLPFYCIFSNEVTFDSGTNKYTVITSWWRERIDIPTGNPIPAELGLNWTYIGTDGVDDRYYRCPQDNCANDETYRWGKYLDSVANILLGDCVNCVDSHFFNFGTPTGSAPINDVYSSGLYENVTIHQKSGIKFPTAAQAPLQQSYDWTFKSFADHLKNMYNVYWFVNSNGCVQFEHISFFTNVAIDVECTPICNIQIDGIDIPRAINFEWMDSESTEYFNGTSGIVYSSKCSTDEVRTVSLEDVTTDLCAMQANPDDFSSSGFVFIANYIDSAALIVYSGNYPHAFTYLHQNLWLHNLDLPGADIEDVPFTALSVKKRKETNQIICGCDCLTGFDPTVLVNTEQGVAQIKQITEKLRSGQLKYIFEYD